MKPQPEIFQAAVEVAGCPPGECFYTDDIAAYIEAARGMGIDAVQFESLAQLEGEMRSRGIVWE
jgi:HAD superfamily hydrolase (TIGR01509 family)